MLLLWFVVNERKAPHKHSGAVSCRLKRNYCLLFTSSVPNIPTKMKGSDSNAQFSLYSSSLSLHLTHSPSLSLAPSLSLFLSLPLFFSLSFSLRMPIYTVPISYGVDQVESSPTSMSATWRIVEKTTSLAFKIHLKSAVPCPLQSRASRKRLEKACCTLPRGMLSLYVRSTYYVYLCISTTIVQFSTYTFAFKIE